MLNPNTGRSVRGEKQSFFMVLWEDRACSEFGAFWYIAYTLKKKKKKKYYLLKGPRETEIIVNYSLVHGSLTKEPIKALYIPARKL